MLTEPTAITPTWNEKSFVSLSLRFRRAVHDLARLYTARTAAAAAAVETASLPTAAAAASFAAAATGVGVGDIVDCEV
jgi:hypothetical protein